MNKEIKPGDDAHITGKYNHDFRKVKIDRVTEKFIFAGGKRFGRHDMRSGEFSIRIITEEEKKSRRMVAVREKILLLIGTASEEKLQAALAALEE